MRLILIISLLLFGHQMSSQESRIYQFDKKLDYSIGATSVGLTLVNYTLYRNLETLDAETILSLNQQDVPSFDRSAIDQSSTAAGNLSDVFEFGVFVLPAPFIFSERMRKETKEITTMYLETFSINFLTTTFIKLTLTRNRPFVFNPNVDISEKMKKTARMSFYSGHVSHTAAMSVFTAKVFSDFYPDSKWKPLVWTGAFAIPTFTGYLRYKAGRHYPSDVVTGIVMGSFFGYIIPHLHKVKSKLPEGLSLNANGNEFGLLYQF